MYGLCAFAERSRCTRRAGQRVAREVRREDQCRLAVGCFARLIGRASEEVAAHEAKVTASIYALYETALKEKDYPAQVMLQWFITEQVEEEKNAAEIVSNLKLIEARGTAVLMLDHRLAKRGGE